MAHGHDSKEKVVYVGDSRVPVKTANSIPQDFSSYPGKSEVFIPNFLLKEWMVAVVFMVGVLALVMSEPAPLGYPADPMNTAFIPMPDWYFLFLYQLLKYSYTSGSYVVFGTVIVPGLLFGGLIIAPFLDNGKERRFYRRPIASSLMIFTLITVTYLTVFSWHHYEVEMADKGMIPEHIKREEERNAAKASGNPVAPPEDKTKKAALPPIVGGDEAGAKIFAKATCIQCHGAELKGMPQANIPALLGVGDKYDKTAIMGIIKNGKGPMPAQYDDNIKSKGLTDADLNTLADWLAKQKKAQ